MRGATADDEVWTAALEADNAGPIQRVFASEGATGPAMRWRPEPADLVPAPLRFLLQHWDMLRGPMPFPRPRQIDPLELLPALGYIALLDPVEEGVDFRYRLFGSIIAHVSGFDMGRRLLSEHFASPYIRAFYTATCRAVMRRREPLASVHTPPAAVSATTWHRLILPLGEEQGTVSRLLIGSVPVNREGRVLGSG